MLSVKVSAVIITYNEERNIAEAIRSVAWADEILVVDSESTDRTREIAETLGTRVIVNPWRGFAGQKQFATDSAVNDWVFSIDADERVTEDLRSEIEALGKGEPTYIGYTVPRRSVYMGRQIGHGGWYPDRQLRLFDRRHGRWKNRVIHESWELTDGSPAGKLNGDLLHYTVESPEEHARMIVERYAPLSARQMLADGKRTSRFKAVVSCVSTFLRAYLLRLGFLDGFPGLLIAYFAAHNSLLKHLLLLKLLDEPSNAQTSGPATTKAHRETSNLS